jgi:Holliday junction resolvase RusA-like endonuclease
VILRFTIPGSIQAKGRHHTVALKRCSCGKTTTAYQCPGCGNTALVFLSNVKLADQPTEKYESFVSLCAMNAGVAQKTYTGVVTLKAIFRFPVPASRKKLKEGDWHTQRPDLDNCLKSILDGLNRVAWHDDSQISQISGGKVWTKGEPGVDVEIEYIDLSGQAVAAEIETRTADANTGADPVGTNGGNRSPFQE